MPTSTSSFAEAIRAGYSELSARLESRSLTASSIMESWSAVPGFAKFLAAGIFAYMLSTALSRRVLNNYSLSKGKWDAGREIVLVTGGSSGIGALMARGFAEQGSRVVILDLVPPKAALPPTVSFYKADVTSSKAIREVAAQIRKEIGDPTVLINNAGVGTVLPILEGTEESNRRTLEVNILAHFITIREFLPSMIKHDHGHVVSIASAASFVTIAGNVDYSCSKAGLVSLHEGLVQELRHFYKAPHIRSSIFHPSWIKTPLLEPLLEIRKFNDALLEPDFVAKAVVDHVQKGESGQVILPAKIGFVLRALKSLPVWLQEAVRNGRAGLLRELPTERPELPK